MSNSEEIIDFHVCLSQCRKAVEALHSHESKKKKDFEENQILPAKEQHIWLNVTLKKASPTYRVKPHRMYVVVNFRNTCLLPERNFLSFFFLSDRLSTPLLTLEQPLYA